MQRVLEKLEEKANLVVDMIQKGLLKKPCLALVAGGSARNPRAARKIREIFSDKEGIKLVSISDLDHVTGNSTM